MLISDWSSDVSLPISLLARVFPGQAGPNDLRLDYLTHGLSWRADYVARLNQAGDRLDLQALVTLSNATDIDFPGAHLRLVAGEEIGRASCRERVFQYV